MQVHRRVDLYSERLFRECVPMALSISIVTYTDMDCRIPCIDSICSAVVLGMSGSRGLPSRRYHSSSGNSSDAH